jgi:ATP-binding cassette, subfamily C, type I secretion system permease/ATPase
MNVLSQTRWPNAVRVRSKRAIAGVDLLLVLKQGRAQAFGPKDEVLSKVLQRDAAPAAPRPLKVVSDKGNASS